MIEVILEPLQVEVGGDEGGDPFGPLRVVHRDVVAHLAEVLRRGEAIGIHGEHRQAGLQCRAAHLDHVLAGQVAVGQQHPGHGYAVHGRQRRGEHDVIAVSRGDDQAAGPEHMQGVGGAAGAEAGREHPPARRLALAEEAGVQGTRHVEHPRGIERGGVGHRADQVETVGAQRR